MPDIQQLFGGPLQRDPSFALNAAPSPAPAKAGPLHRVQFVIELVGPRTATAQQVKALLQPNWFQALGQPEIFVMAAADAVWRPLRDTDIAGAYDSIALAWDMVKEGHKLSKASAQHLLGTAESFAQAVGRRAMPMPLPEDIDSAVRVLGSLQENFDVGVNLSVLPQVALFPEKEIWIGCAALGLDLSPNGLFEWKAAGGPPVLGVGPLTNYAGFSLSQVSAGVVHEGLDVGFSLPRSPDPMNGLEACFRVAEYLGRRLQGVPVDEDDQPLTERSKATLREQLREGDRALRSAGIVPGSAEALKLFANV